MSGTSSGSEPLRPSATAPGVTGGCCTEAADGDLVQRLRQGEEIAFQTLVERYSSSLLRVAMLYVPSRAVAEEVVQETWLGVIQGIDGFQGRSSLKTWLFTILTNRARSRGKRERHSIPFSETWDAQREPGEPAISPQRFLDASHPEWPGHWAEPPASWEADPERRLLSRETQAFLLQAIEALPPAQREVMTLRDLEEWTAEEVCNALGITETNQRVLLHRARSRVRQALETHLQTRDGWTPRTKSAARNW